MPGGSLTQLTLDSTHPFVTGTDWEHTGHPSSPIKVCSLSCNIQELSGSGGLSGLSAVGVDNKIYGWNAPAYGL